MLDTNNITFSSETIIIIIIIIIALWFFFIFLKGRKKIREYFRISWKKKFWFFWHGNWNLQNKKRIWFHHTYSNVELAIMVVCYGIKTTSKRRMIITHLSLSLSLFSFFLSSIISSQLRASSKYSLLHSLCLSILGLWLDWFVSAFSNFQPFTTCRSRIKGFFGYLKWGADDFSPFVLTSDLFFFLTNFVTFFDSKNLQRFWKRKILGFFFFFC